MSTKNTVLVALCSLLSPLALSADLVDVSEWVDGSGASLVYECTTSGCHECSDYGTHLKERDPGTGKAEICLKQNSVTPNDCLQWWGPHSYGCVEDGCCSSGSTGPFDDGPMLCGDSFEGTGTAYVQAYCPKPGGGWAYKLIGFNGCQYGIRVERGRITCWTDSDHDGIVDPGEPIAGIVDCYGMHQ